MGWQRLASQLALCNAYTIRSRAREVYLNQTDIFVGLIFPRAGN